MQQHWATPAVLTFSASEGTNRRMARSGEGQKEGEDRLTEESGKEKRGKGRSERGGCEEEEREGMGGRGGAEGEWPGRRKEVNPQLGW